MDIIAQLTKILMDGRTMISAVMTQDAVLIIVLTFLIRDRWVVMCWILEMESKL